MAEFVNRRQATIYGPPSAYAQATAHALGNRCAAVPINTS